VDLAVRCAGAREAGFDPARAVLVHGDVHEHNALRVPGTGGFRLVDPSGLLSEPAHDLGVILARGVTSWLEQLAASDPRRARAAVARGCRRAGRLTGVDPRAIWQWTFTELVSTGLFVLRRGHGEAGRRFLAVADKLCTGAKARSSRELPSVM
jgi:streptomycin 6-kinase